MTGGSNFRAALRQASQHDNMNIIDTRNANIGPWFVYASAHDREIMALFRFLVEHNANNAHTKNHTRVLTTLPNVENWEPSKMHIQVAQNMVREAIDMGDIILETRDEDDSTNETSKKHIATAHEMIKDAINN